jgi:hypothetical protein
MPMFTLCDAILFSCVWACDTVLDPLTGDELREATILIAPVKLEVIDFSVKKQLNILLKQMKSFLNVRFALKKINPSESTKVTQKANIVLKMTNK